MAVVYIAYEVIVGPDGRHAFVDEAATIGLVQSSADLIRDLVPTEMPSFLDDQINQLMGDCRSTPLESGAVAPAE